MSYAEHAIENAIVAFESGKTFEEWRDRDPNLKYLKADPWEVWEMAVYASTMKY